MSNILLQLFFTIMLVQTTKKFYFPDPNSETTKNIWVSHSLEITFVVVSFLILLRISYRGHFVYD